MNAKSNIGETEAIAAAKGHSGLILYDGVCGLCNRSVKIVLDSDPAGRFQFASLQSPLAQTLLTSLGKDPAMLKSIYLIKGLGTDNVTFLAKAEAAIDIAGQLEGPIRYLKLLSILPVWLLNLGYDLIAANRYWLFGKYDACPMPNPAHLKRFLDQ
jgi:predicted DCC family thiol-disulfide oxidoreductase YuxK